MRRDLDKRQPSLAILDRPPLGHLLSHLVTAESSFFHASPMLGHPVDWKSPPMLGNRNRFLLLKQKRTELIPSLALSQFGATLNFWIQCIEEG